MHVIMTHSYKGGSGKTLFSINAAHILSQRYDKKVLLVETDFEMPIFFDIFRENKPDLFFNDYLNQSSESLLKYIYPNIRSNLGIIYASPEFKPSDQVFSMNPKWFESKLNQIRKDLMDLDYDYVIFDLAPGKNLFTAVILVLSNTVFMVLRPDSYSVNGVRALIESFYTTASLITSKEVLIVFNQIPIHEKIDDLINPWKISLSEASEQVVRIYEINFHNETAFNVAKNNLILDFNDPTSLKVQDIINDLVTASI